MTKDLTLQEQLAFLTRQIQQLDERISHLERAGSPLPKAAAETDATSPAPAVKNYRQEESALLAGGSNLLKHVSAVCFLLVIGLGLRALSDSDLLSLSSSTILGLVYAFLLIIVGFFLYRGCHSLAPVVTLVGALLSFSVLLETHSRFSALPSAVVYLLLAITGILLTLISFRHATALPIIVGSLGMCLTAVAIDFPNPYFPYLGLILWLSNILGFFASRIKRCTWLRWLLMFTTHFMLQIWGLKISGILSNPDIRDTMGAEWFVPVVTLIGFTFMMISLFGIIRSGDTKISRFDYSLPAINATWCYVAGIYALKSPELFGVPAAIAAAVHFGLVFWLAQRQRSNAPGTNTFTAGGSILMGLSLPALMGGMLLPLPFLAVMALIVCICSSTWNSGGMRVTSYVLQGYILVVLAIEAASRLVADSVPIMIVALICSWLALQHYRYCRQNLPPAESVAFSRYDTRDRSAVLLLLTCLTSMLISSAALGYFLLSRHYSGPVDAAFISLQTLIITGSAIILIVLAVRRHNRELRNIACLVMVLGGVKVIAFDIFQVSGPWLVSSLLAFGVTAATQSLILARWKAEPQKITPTPLTEKDSR